jgi:hypothetical protein
MKLRELIKEMAASSGSSTPSGPGGSPPAGPANSDSNSQGKLESGSKPPGGGQGLSGQGTLKSTGVFIGHETAEQKHDYTAKSVVGKGIEWTKPTGTVSSDEKVYKETELETPGEHHSVGHDSEGVTEDAEASSTVSGDIATVAYPLFVRGKNKKEKRKNARAAVGQKYVPGPAGIGTGVFESTLKEMASKILSVKDEHGFITIIVQAPDGTKKAMANDNPNYIQKWLQKYGLTLPKSITSKFVGVEEAHTLNSNNVIYRLDRENPMSDTEVAVLGGAGRYSLKALRDKARREAAELAQDLSIEHGGAFRRSATNIKQLTNTINTIVAAYNELARLRRKGGRGSRGITDEDANFIRECIRVVEQATQNYRLMENLTIGNSQNKGIKK